MAEVGPHLLGRKASLPDERDFRAANFRSIGVQTTELSVEDLVKLGVQELMKTTTTYKRWAAREYEDVKVTHWWKALNYFSLAVNPSPAPTPAENVLWESKIQLDQGDTGHCVGFGCAGWGIAAPVEDVYDDDDGHAIYYEAKTIEGDPKGEDGAYTRDGAKAMVARGRMGTYAFLYAENEIRDWLRNKGPIIVGTDWTSDMFWPDANGVIVPSGNVEGGHCYVLIGIDDDYFVFKNSWGNSWGDNGYFRMLINDFMSLMDDFGETIASVELTF